MIWIGHIVQEIIVEGVRFHPKTLNGNNICTIFAKHKLYKHRTQQEKS